MTLSELIANVGDDNVQFQSLDEATESCTLTGNTGRFTFHTDPKHALERATGEPSHIALVVWLPVDKLPDNMRPQTTQES